MSGLLACCVLVCVAAVLALFTRETRPDVAPPKGLPLLHRAAIVPGTTMFLGLIALAGYTAFLKLYGATVGIHDVGGYGPGRPVRQWLRRLLSW